MRTFLILLIFTSFFSNTHAVECPEKKEAKTFLGKQWKRLKNIDFSLAPSLDPLGGVEGVSLPLKIEASVRPSFYKDFYARIEQVQVKSKLIPSEWFAFSEDIAIFGEKSAKTYYGRQFECWRKAVFELPKNPKHYPLSSKKLIKHMKDYDFFIIESDFAWGVGSNPGTSLVSVELGHAYLGEFAVQIIKLPENKVNFRLIHLGKRAWQINLRTDLFNFDTFSFNPLNDLVENIISPTKLVRASISKSKGQMILADYALDFNNPEVQSAYNQVLNNLLKSSLKFNRLKKRNKAKMIRYRWLDFSPFNRLEMLDRDKEEKRVIRRTMGFGKFVDWELKFGFGKNFIQFDTQKTRSDNTFNILGENNAIEKQINYSLKEKRNRFELFFKLLFSERRFQNYVIDTKEKTKRSKAYVYTQQIRDNFFSKRKQKRYYKKLKRFASRSFLNHVLNKGFFNTMEQKNTGSRYRIIITQEYFDYLKTLSKEKLKEIIITGIKNAYLITWPKYVENHKKDIEQLIDLVKKGNLAKTLFEKVKKKFRRIRRRNWVLKNLGLSPFLIESNEKVTQFFYDFNFSSSHFPENNEFSFGSSEITSQLNAYDIIRSGFLELKDYNFQLIYTDF